MAIENSKLEYRRKSLDEILSSDPHLLAIQQKLVETFKPKRIFLFGSRAYGNSNLDSDYDFLVVVETTLNTRIENMQKAREALFEFDVSADVFVYPESEFEDWKNELNSIAEAAYKLGVELPLG